MVGIHITVVFMTCSILDINECFEGLSSCNQLCINTIGNYDCDCYAGFNLKSDNRTCLGIYEIL